MMNGKSDSSSGVLFIYSRLFVALLPPAVTANICTQQQLLQTMFIAVRHETEMEGDRGMNLFLTRRRPSSNQCRTFSWLKASCIKSVLRLLLLRCLSISLNPEKKKKNEVNIAQTAAAPGTANQHSPIWMSCQGSRRLTSDSGEVWGDVFN